MLLGRKRIAVNSMPRSGAFEVLQVDMSRSLREIKQKHMMLARKHHPDE